MVVSTVRKYTQHITLRKNFTLLCRVESIFGTDLWNSRHQIEIIFQKNNNIKVNMIRLFRSNFIEFYIETGVSKFYGISSSRIDYNCQIKIVYCATRKKKNLFCECEVWCTSKARITTRVKLMFFPCRTQFFSARGSENGFVCPRRGNKIHFMTR